MPSLFSRAFSCTCDASGAAEDAPKCPSLPIASSPASNPNSNSWFGRLRANFNFSVMARARRKKGRAAEHSATMIRHERDARASETRPSSNAASEVSSIPSLSRLDSTVSSASVASVLGVCSPAIRVQVDDTDVMRTLKGMQAAVPESPRISFRGSLPPTLEGEDSISSRQPSYCVTGPQLYPYIFSADDIWAEEIVANILADYSRSARP